MNNERPNPQSIVFVVDDDASVREALSSLVRSVGLQVEMFASAPEFLARKLPDVASCLVLDIRLPGLSGLDFQTELAKAKKSITGHLHYRPRRYPDVREGHESRRDRIPD